jgi:hypothetical protein
MAQRGGQGIWDNLNQVKVDLMSDISVEARPFSSLNYAAVTALMMAQFYRIEHKLKDLRNPLWVRAYVYLKFIFP